MLKTTALPFLLFISTFCFAQPTYHYWVQFTNKEHSPFSISAPQEFLSQRAIDRRERYNIDIRENDLPVSPAYIDSLKQAGFSMINRSKWFNAVTVKTTDSLLFNYLQSAGFVLQFELVKQTSGKTSIDKFLAEESIVLEGGDFEVPYGRSYHQLEMVRGEALHNLGFKGRGMHIAVLDAGFRNADQMEAFAELRNSGRLLGTRDFVDGGEFVYDYSSHGSSVLSVMTGQLDGMIIGTAPEASYYLFRTEESAHETLIEEDNWVSGAEFADSAGVDVINSSLGYTKFDDASQNHTYSDMDGNTTRITIGADIAASKGILVVNSAGNSGNGNWHYIGAPADGDSVFAIGAVDSLEVKATFSSFGPSSDGDIKPNVSGMGHRTILANQSGSISQGSGTSFSSPLIAGMMACLWQANQELTNIELMEIVQSTASQAENPDDDLGYGIPDFSEAFFEVMANSDAPIYSKLQVPILYPNPVLDVFNVMVYPRCEADVVIQVCNLLGEKMLEKMQCLKAENLNRIHIDEMAFAASGVYVVRILGLEGEYQERFVKLSNR